MPFEPVTRFKYKKDPIDTVICQVRYPNNLAVEEENIYKFQKEISRLFTEYEPKIETNTFLEIDKYKHINQMNHEFLSKNQHWKVNLTKNFMSLSTTKYDNWEEFVSIFKIAFEALTKTYEIPYFTRVGLRYVDVFVRSRYGLSDKNWKELIKSDFLGALSGKYYESVKEFNAVSTIQCEDKTTLIRISTDLVKRVDNEEICFRLDNDIYSTTKIDKEDIYKSLEYKHDRVSRVLRYAITDLMHEKMEPGDFNE